MILQHKMAYSPLSSLSPQDRLKTICVRVVRKWEFRGMNDDDPSQHVDLILADDQVQVLLDKQFASSFVLKWPNLFARDQTYEAFDHAGKYHVC